MSYFKDEFVRSYHAPLSRNQIDMVSEAVGIAFPEDYVAFMETTGGVTFKDFGLIPINGTPSKPHYVGIVIDEILPIKPPSELASVFWDEWECFRERIPAGFFPIALDGFGNRILMSASGRCVFWDHEVDDGEQTALTLMTVAPTFSRFLNLLRPFPTD
jgi:hypothetical protein